MTYGFLIYGEPDQGRLAAVLAEMLSLPEQAVDVGDDGEDERNWAAPVSCTVTRVAGDLHLHLDIWIDGAVANTPPTAMAAGWLASRLRTVVAYEAVPYPPSAYWLVGPDGRRTRARIHEDDGHYRIEAVERAVSGMPGLRVEPLPEVIRQYRMPTSVTDRVRSELPPKVAQRLGAWEGMVVRLVEGWPPDGWYPAEYYREDLETRDELAAALEVLEGPGRDEAVRALSEVDGRFEAATEEDGGQALAAATGQPVGAGWWWRRVPRAVPWRDVPG